MRRLALVFGLTLTALSLACERTPGPTGLEDGVRPDLARTGGQTGVGVNLLLDRPPTAEILDDLSRHGTVTGRIDAIRAVFLVAPRSDLGTLRSLPYVEAANLDAERSLGPPRPPVEVSDFANGLNTWNLDAVEVTDLGAGRTLAADGSGVYVGVLDTGLLDSWNFYFPEERIAVEHARSFTGGGALDAGAVPSQPNKWEHDVHSHGTHVTSTILGYNLLGTPVNGVAPRATVVPVKVLNNNGSGWSSMVARGIVYMADLKAGALAGAPVVVNMSLGGSQLDAVEQAAIDYALDRGVILVASAGNNGEEGMGYPGAYPPVISAGASGWTGEWISGRAWWVSDDVPDPTAAEDFYVTGFSSREKPDQDLDVLAPGSWVVGPWQLDQGHVSYFFVGGTSMAAPHVAGVVALMAQARPGLNAAEAEAILESTAVPLSAGSAAVLRPDGSTEELTWGADATGSGLVVADDAVAEAASSSRGGRGRK